MKLSSVQKDRAAGVMLGSAAGDALGAGYEFHGPYGDDIRIFMKGGTAYNWHPGEWTDDTSMAVPILRAAAERKDLRDEAVLDEIVAAWVDWSRTAPDVGVQLSAVLHGSEPTAASARESARRLHGAKGRSAGNGSLMRTAPVVLGYLNDAEALAVAARTISDLTHYESDAGDACVIWCLAIRHAVLTGELDVRVGLGALPDDRRHRWEALIIEAEQNRPSDFPHNGWVVQALQGAWSSIVQATTGGQDARVLRSSLENAVRGGKDTDTVAAIAGALVGAAYGASAVPAEWRRVIHGWPGLTGPDLAALAIQAVDGRSVAEQTIDYSSYGDISTLVQHPHDSGVWLGGVGALGSLPDEVDAVISLCRTGAAQVPERISEHLNVRLIDSDDENDNPNLRYVLNDTVDAIAALRAEGHTVFVHCVQAVSRTPTVAALYAVRHLGVPADKALAEIIDAMPLANPNLAFRALITSTVSGDAK